jgi:ferredoxin-NADP reductase
MVGGRRGGAGRSSRRRRDGRHRLSAAELLRMVPDVAERDVFLCGPAGLMTTVRADLRSVGLPPGHLHEERFSF